MVASGSGSDGSRWEITRRSNRANAQLAPLLLPFEHLAVGSGWDGQESYSVVVLTHESRAAAIENASRLAERFYSTNSSNGLPWALKLPHLELSVSGKYLVAKFRGQQSANYIGSFSNQLLFAHE